MQYSIVNLNEVKNASNDFLIHAEFFRPKIQKFRKYAKDNNFQKLENYVDYIKRGIQPSYSKYGIIPVLRSVNIREYGITEDRQEYIDESFYKFKKQGQVNYKDILLTSTGVGTLGRCLISQNNNKYFIDGHITILKNLKELLPEFLYIYLNSKYGQNQINVLYKGSSGQIEIYPDDIKQILIKPLKIQQSIADLVNTSYTLRQSADTLYKEAENILLEELGLKDFKPQNKKCFIKNLSNTQEVGRFDAEYFQPKYEDIIEKIKGYKGGYDILENFIENYSTGYPYKSEKYQNSGIPVIRIANIGKNKLELENNPAFISEEYSNISKKDIAKAGNILISMSGTIGNVAEIPENIKKCCINQRVLSFKSKNINNKYLVLFLNSLFGYTQFEQIGVGGLQVNLSYNDIKNLIIPLLHQSIQTLISSKIQQSFKNREKSKQLLDVAKRAVEIAIEENEEAGLKYIEENK